MRALCVPQRWSRCRTREMQWWGHGWHRGQSSLLDQRRQWGWPRVGLDYILSSCRHLGMDSSHFHSCTSRIPQAAHTAVLAVPCRCPALAVLAARVSPAQAAPQTLELEFNTSSIGLSQIGSVGHRKTIASCGASDGHSGDTVFVGRSCT